MVYVKGFAGGLGLLLVAFFAQVAYQLIRPAARPQAAITPSVAFNPVSTALSVAVFALGFAVAARYWQ
jgi:hypothetical protein